MTKYLYLGVALALAALLSFSHFSAFRAGKQHVRNEWSAATAEANAESRRLEQQRQRRADEASNLAAKRSRDLAADARAASTELGRMRESVNAAERMAKESSAAADQYRAACSKLLIESGELLTEIARSADGHSSDVRLLLDAFPK